MAGSVNKVILVGNLGKDPEVRSSGASDKIVSFNLATSETWTDKASEERKERTEWHRVVVFNTQIADVAERFLKKGAKVYVEGALQTRKWTDQQGVERYSTEIVLARFKGEMTMLSSGNGGNRQENSERSTGGGYLPAPVPILMTRSLSLRRSSEPNSRARADVRALILATVKIENSAIIRHGCLASATAWRREAATAIRKLADCRNPSEAQRLLREADSAERQADDRLGASTAFERDEQVLVVRSEV
jgi:single-strand DNA-binding protein